MDVVVIGGGAAGLNGALVLGRARREVLVVDAGEPRNAPAAHMQGFLSRDGMPPADLLAEGRRELAGYGVEVATGRVSSVTRDDDGFVVTFGERTVRARRLLVTTGLTDELPDVPGVRERWGRDVIHCPYCHGWEVRDQPIGVLASGPGSVHQASLFRQWTSDLVFFENSINLTDDERKLFAARGIQVVPGEVERLVVSGDVLTGVRLRSGEVVARSTVAVGPRMVANSALLTSLGLEPTPHPMGEFVESDPSGLSSVPGVWLAGNVTDLAASVIMAAAGGAKAGMAINFDLLQEDNASVSA
ncbi:NAD(P)/FAD-dependent oxidoreductase [Lentzea tibetensis]|uniref:NAD(P)/FAD-dependent oxidoreductase n=1 Tax=Lentzea tibetensis TaxID=2591470 RepID=A0A563EGU0_9PSEU|nr:NAD(P)/FAD-dependent oxidoreductase [Lentzea tibetensis]TWP44044.1 NAD(P)/FAD-dependent oxidoreductase [Lentzea tibetensis]